MKPLAFLLAVVVASPVLAGCFGFGGDGGVRGDPDGPLEAAFRFEPEAPGVGQSVRFVDESTGPVAQWIWEFGDGTTSARQDPSHTYTKADVYLVRLTVRDAAGNRSTAERFVGVDVDAPAGTTSVAIDAQVKGLAVSFRALVSPTGTPVSQYFWDFGDGAVSREPAPVHTYAEAATYHVVLRVSANGTIHEAQRSVDVGSFASLGPLASRSMAVIAIVDSGVNPYHEEFRDSAFQDHPATYITDYPADAEALPLTFTASQYTKAVSEDEEVWEEAKANTLYYVPGTRIVGAISIAKRGAYPILDDQAGDDGHGTATASIAAGETIGTCPTCLIVVVEGLGEQSIRWAMDQPWIDVVSNSWSYCSLLVTCDVDPGIMPPLVHPVNVDASRRAVEEGKTILFASGNGWLNAFDVPQMTYTHPQTGPDWIVTVGAADADSGATVLGTGRPVDVVSFGWDWRGASHNSMSAVRDFSGTSSATPVVAGAFGHVIQGARDALNDTREGPHGSGMLARGEAPGDLGSGSTIADGELTRAEAQRLIYLTARRADGIGPVLPTTLPDSPAYFLYAGYGLVDHATAQKALDIVLGTASQPTKTDADQWAAVDSAIRVAVWGSWNDGGDLRQYDPDIPTGLAADDADDWGEVVDLFENAYPDSDASA